VSIRDVEVVLPDYRYRAEDRGIVENEFCPVMIGRISGEPRPAENEVASIAWVTWDELVERCVSRDPSLSPWCIEEVLLLDSNPRFRKALERIRKNDP
jgi:isopentenyl-diphosphate delta-isomerase